MALGDNDTKRQRRRMLVKFWLERGNGDQDWLIDIVLFLKGKRQLAKTMREAIALIWTLRDGNTEVLEHLFPNVVARIQAQAREDLMREAAYAAFVNAMRTQDTPRPPARQALPDPNAVEVSKGGKASAKEVANNFISSAHFFD